MDKSMQIALILTAVDQATAVINSAANNAAHTLGEFQEKTESMSKSAFKLGRESGELALGAGELLREPMKAFSEMQEASDSLEAVMMTAGGKTSKAFEEMNESATKLGESLPGTVADFKSMYAIMLQNGASAESILNGNGKAVAELATVTHQSVTDTADSVMHLKNAAGIGDEDLGKLTDTLARLNNVGAQTSDLESVFAKSSQQLKTLGLQGAEATASVGTIFSLFLKQGMSSKMVGTGLSDVLDKLYDTKKVKDFQAKSEALGLHIQFLDENTGKFKGVENMVAQFDKIKNANLGTADKKDLISSLFGDGSGSNIAMGLIDGGIDAYNKAQLAMSSQATVSQKAQFLAKSVANQWESAWKKFEITLGNVGAKLLPLIQSLIQKFTAVTEKIQGFITKHPTLVAWMGKALAIFAAVAASVSILSFMFGGCMKALSILSGGLKTGIAILKGTYSVLRTVATQGVRFLSFAYNFATSSVTRLRVAVMLKNLYLKAATIASRVYAGALNVVKFASSALALGQKLLTGALGLAQAGFYGVRTAITTVTTAMKANPILAIIMAIVTVATLLIENWDSVKKFFVNMWNYIKGLFTKSWEWIKATIYKYSGIKLIVETWGKVKTFFSDMWTKIKGLFTEFWEWVKGIIIKYSGIKLIMEGWGKVKTFFSDMWTKIKGTFTGFFDWLKGIPGRLWQAGKNMVNSLWEGIKSMIMKPINSFKDMLHKIRKMLPFSPAKEGPLVDIHRIRLVETIADGIKPNALIDKMKKVTSLAIAPLQPAMQAAGVNLNGGSITPIVSGGGGGGNSQFSYNPTIHINGSTNGNNSPDFSTMLKDHAKEFEKMMTRFMADKARKTIA